MFFIKCNQIQLVYVTFKFRQVLSLLGRFKEMKAALSKCSW